jgi:hypothetical protein
MWREAAPDASCGGRLMQLFARGRRLPASPRRRPMDHAEHRAERELATDLEPCLELLPRPAVHPDLASLAALSSSDQHRAAGAIEVALLESKRLADAQAGPPEQHDQPAESVAVGAVTEDPHHRDDLLDVGGSAGYCSPVLRGGRPR